jgi:hypothetical protein
MNFYFIFPRDILSIIPLKIDVDIAVVTKKRPTDLYTAYMEYRAVCTDELNINIYFFCC